MLVFVFEDDAYYDYAYDYGWAMFTKILNLCS